MNYEYRNEIRIAICTALVKSGRYLLSQDAIVQAVKPMVSPEPSYQEVEEAIASLDREGFVVVGRASLTGQASWKLTAAGQAAVRELNQA